MKKTLQFSVFLLLLVTNQAFAQNFAFDGNGILKCDDAAVGEEWSDGGTTYTAVDRDMLDTMIGDDTDPLNVCTSHIENMRELFYENSNFNQDIGKWNVSKVTDMTFMFSGAELFNQDLSNWCVTEIATLPTGFFHDSPLEAKYLPIWGTCPEQPVSNELEEMAVEFSLLQNYPNPFNPTTNIRYGITEPTEVSLGVYNMLGQKVATLLNGKQSTGWHTVSFNASALSSGFYIYRIQAGDFVSTKKLMLIK